VEKGQKQFAGFQEGDPGRGKNKPRQTAGVRESGVGKHGNPSKRGVSGLPKKEKKNWQQGSAATK